MQRAEKNIEGMLTEMTRTFHRIRQESIAEELFDVLSAFDGETGIQTDGTRIAHP